MNSSQQIDQLTNAIIGNVFNNNNKSLPIQPYELSGYKAFHTIRSHKKGDGVAIYVKIYLIAQSIKVN